MLCFEVRLKETIKVQENILVRILLSDKEAATNEGSLLDPVFTEMRISVYAQENAEIVRT